MADKVSFSSRYRIESKLGTGGMGAVFRAFDLVLDKPVALKLVLPRHSSDLAVRFQKEAKTAGKLDHPNIVKVLDFGQTEKGELYLIMELIEGQGLDKLVENGGPLQPRFALHVFNDICKGMQYAHEHGVLHRDIKPSNIMLAHADNQVVIVDFGVAKLATEDQKLTSTNARVGSPNYMSPEQARGEDVDRRSDIYSMGCLMFMVLTGEPPLTGETYLETIQMQISDPAPLLRERVDEDRFTLELEQLVDKALQKDPAKRFQSFAQLQEAIQQVLEITAPEEEAQAPEKSAEIKAYRPTGRKARVKVITVSAAVGALSIIAMVSYMVMRPDGQVQNKVVEKKRRKHAKEAEESNVDFTVALGWCLASGNLHKTGIKRICKDSPETRMSFMDPDLDNSDLRFLENKPLVALDVSGTKITPAGFRQHPIPTLKGLILNDNKQVNDENISELAPLNLQVLALRGTSITDKGVEQLAKMQSLRMLDLERLKGVTGKSLDLLSGLPNLMALRIGDTSIGADSFNKLLKFPSLRYLSLNKLPIKDADLDTIMKLSPLSLSLRSTKITEKGLKKIANANFPVTVDVCGCELISDAQVLAYSMPRKYGIPRLKMIRMMDQLEKMHEPDDEEIQYYVDTMERPLNIALWYEPDRYRTQFAPGYPDMEKWAKANEKQNNLSSRPQYQNQMNMSYESLEAITNMTRDRVREHGWED